MFDLVDFLGSVPYDENLKKAVQKQKAVVEAFPRSPASTAFKQIGKKTMEWPMPQSVEGHLEFFIERLVSYSAQEDRL